MSWLKQSGAPANSGALPLHKGQKVAYHAFADHPRYSVVIPARRRSHIDAAVLHGRKIHYIEGFPATGDQRDEAEFLCAVAAAEAADAAVIFAGLPECAELAAATGGTCACPECWEQPDRPRPPAEEHRRGAATPSGHPVECLTRCIVGFRYVFGGRGSGEAT